jgi:hypothetical protein
VDRTFPMALHTCLRCGIYLPAKDSQLTVSDSTFHETQALQFWLLSRRVRSLSRASARASSRHISLPIFKLVFTLPLPSPTSPPTDLFIRNRKADRPGGLFVRVNERTTGSQNELSEAFSRLSTMATRIPHSKRWG